MHCSLNILFDIREVDDNPAAALNQMTASVTPAQWVSGLLQRAPAVPGPFSNWPGFGVSQQQASAPFATSAPPAAQQGQIQQQTSAPFASSAPPATQPTKSQQLQPITGLTGQFLSQSARYLLFEMSLKISILLFPKLVLGTNN